jgi:hypothetical protein
MKNPFRMTVPILLLATSALAAGSGIKLVPNLQPSQRINYLIRYQSEKNVKTEGAFAAPMAPSSAQMDSRALLEVEVLDVQSMGNTLALHARARFLALDSSDLPKKSGDKKPDLERQPIDPQSKAIEFTISSEGLVEKVQGLDSFLPEQQQAWQEWVARFALAWTFPKEGVKPGGKWKSEQVEKAVVPIAGLNWERESTYVGNEPCHATFLSGTGEASRSAAPSDTCAVVLTTATLKQKSSAEDATPEDFKRHDLHTEGTATGHNEIITYISLQNGMLVRATEQANQSMDVVVALADRSNSVHYNVNATSHSEVLLVTDSPLAHP